MEEPVDGLTEDKELTDIPKEEEAVASSVSLKVIHSMEVSLF